MADVDVIVIGAGVAGLAAAGELARAGRSVAMLEGRDRVGGRIHTEHQAVFGQPVELGAEFIHGHPPSTWEIVRAAGLMPYELCDDHWKLEGHRLVKAEDFWAELDVVMGRLDGAKAGESFDAFAARCCDDAEARRALPWARSYVEGFNAADANRASAEALAEGQKASEQIEATRLYRLIGGYDRLVSVLRDRVDSGGAAIRLNTVVRTVRWNERGVEVTTERGQRFAGRRALITLPLGVLQGGTVAFEPPLPVEKTAAVRRLAMGAVTKVILRFDEPFWETRRVPSVKSDQEGRAFCFLHGLDLALPTWWTLRPVHAPIWVGWAGGPAAARLSGRPEGEVIEAALISLGTMLGMTADALRSRLRAARVADWLADPFSRGAYTYIPVGGERAMEALAAPVKDRLFFAGEATDHTGLGGTVAGAIASGKRAAAEILRGA